MGTSVLWEARDWIETGEEGAHFEMLVCDCGEWKCAISLISGAYRQAGREEEEVVFVLVRKW